MEPRRPRPLTSGLCAVLLQVELQVDVRRARDEKIGVLLLDRPGPEILIEVWHRGELGAEVKAHRVKRQVLRVTGHFSFRRSILAR